eukprot:CAMPEP_0195084660 /NCGR_PEP_ID=MMETSP0448-20130528/25295_1 /TAXON_ID=66468 /ORGANISM="Heterocapsa triquestra, Strain CCMP 448" /LENGTH=57 /DNA_ID=CAMNT_0040118005 /DNA_START=87 /DNA_END=258 /DNA_ORIENTATION=-
MCFNTTTVLPLPSSMSPPQDTACFMAFFAAMYLARSLPVLRAVPPSPAAAVVHVAAP